MQDCANSCQILAFHLSKKATKKNLAKDNRPQHETPGNNYRVFGVYSPEPRAEVYCIKVGLNWALLFWWNSIGIFFIKIH